MGLGRTDGGASELAVVDSLHDVPAADSAVNVNLRDVVGNKSDARSDAVTASLMALLRETLFEAVEIEHHFHNHERWLGISGDQSGNNWALDTLAPFQAISGNNDYGADVNDEALVLGTDDTPIQAGKTRFDFHRIFIVNVSVDTPWKLRIIHGTGTMADAITAGQFTEAVVMADATNPQQSAGTPLDVIMPRLYVGIDKVWVQAWNATNDATIDFLIGLHEYDV